MSDLTLAELDNQRQQSAGNGPLVVNIFGSKGGTGERPPQSVRGDDLIAQTRQFYSVNDIEKEEIELFQNSQSLLMQIAEAEPETYQREIEPEMMKRQGWELGQWVIDKADEYKRAALREKYPEMFSSPNAAVQSFLNTQAFGQLTRLQAGAKTLVGSPTQSGDDPTFDNHLRETAEWARLLKKEFPKTDIAAELASYMVGAPAKMFTALSGLGGKGAEMVLKKLTDNPKIMERMASQMTQSAVGSGIGGAAIGAVRGFLGKDDESFSFDRSMSEAAKMGGAAMVLGAGLPPALKYGPLETIGAVGGATIGGIYGAPGTGAAIGAGAGAALRVAGRANKFIPGIVGNLSGMDPKAARMYNKNATEMLSHSGKKPEIAREFIDFVFSDAIKALPERVEADKLLPLLPDVETAPLLNFLEQKIANPTKEQAAVMAELADRAKWVRGQIKIHGGKNGRVSAEGMRDITDQLQEVVSSYYQKDRNAIPDWANPLKEAAAIGRGEIVGTAERFGGANGKQYVDLMAKAAEKRQALKLVTDKLGKDYRYWPKAVENYMNQMFGRSGTAQSEAMKAIDKTFGTDFFAKAEMAHYADKLGPLGPSPVNEVRTGAYTKGTSVGATVGGTLGGALGGILGAGVGDPMTGAKVGGAIGATVGGGVGFAASSPKVGAMIIGTSDKISGVINAINKYPDVLIRLQSSNAPKEVKKMATILDRTLKADGPVSMGSAMRVMADFPLFVGLVHHMHKSLTAEERAALQAGLEKMEAEQIARQQQAEDKKASAPKPGKFY